MKKFLLLTIALGTGIFICFAGANKNEATRKAIIKGCMDKVPKEVPNDIATEYCSCSADAVLKKYTPDDIANMEERVRKGDESLKAEMTKIVQPCVDEFTRKLEERMAEKE